MNVVLRNWRLSDAKELAAAQFSLAVMNARLSKKTSETDEEEPA